MSAVRFGAALAEVSLNVQLVPEPVIQASQASAVLSSRRVILKPRAYYLWVYNLEGEKVAVIA